MNRDTTLDDEALGHAVDAWLVALRRQGLSDRRIRDLAGLLGQAMSQTDNHTPKEATVLARFETWWQGHVHSAITLESKPRHGRNTIF